LRNIRRKTSRRLWFSLGVPYSRTANFVMSAATQKHIFFM